MRKLPACLLSLLISFIPITYADTCPPADGLSPSYPPSGWTLLMGPTTFGKSYVFLQAIHSLNLAFYYQQVICKYIEPVQMSSAFTLLSTKTYLQPMSRTPPWSYPSAIKNTLTCNPNDHNPSHCVFE